MQMGMASLRILLKLKSGFKRLPIKGNVKIRSSPGADALGYHLIDQLGDFDTAVEKARELCGSANAPVFAYSLRRDWRAWLTSFAAPAKPIEAKALERVLPAATLQPGVRYYLLPAAVN